MPVRKMFAGDVAGAMLIFSMRTKLAGDVYVDNRVRDGLTYVLYELSHCGSKGDLLTGTSYFPQLGNKILGAGAIGMGGGLGNIEAVA